MFTRKLAMITAAAALLQVDECYRHALQHNHERGKLLPLALELIEIKARLARLAQSGAADGKEEKRELRAKERADKEGD